MLLTPLQPLSLTPLTINISKSAWGKLTSTLFWLIKSFWLTMMWNTESVYQKKFTDPYFYGFTDPYGVYDYETIPYYGTDPCLLARYLLFTYLLLFHYFTNGSRWKAGLYHLYRRFCIARVWGFILSYSFIRVWGLILLCLSIHPFRVRIDIFAAP